VEFSTIDKISWYFKLKLRFQKVSAGIFNLTPTSPPVGVLKSMNKIEIILLMIAIFGFGWILGRFTEAWVLGNLGF
jgi:hypothetical protein